MSSRLSVNSSNHSKRSCKRSSGSRRSSLFLFLSWVFTGSHQLPGAIPSLRSKTGLEDELDESCDGDVEDETLPELVEKPRTTRGTKLSVWQMIVFPSLVNRVF